MTSSQAPELRYQHLSGKPHGPIISLVEVGKRGWDTFLILAQAIARRTSLSYTAPGLTSVVIAASDAPNAYAYVNAGLGSEDSLIVLNSGLISELQVFAGASQSVLEHELSNGSGSSHLDDIWRGMPRTSEHFRVFAELVGHVTLVVLTNHELAHISFNHNQFYGNDAGTATDGGEAHVVDEAATAASLDERDQASDRLKQAMEMDADIHALQWTRDYLKELGEGHVRSPVSSDKVANEVWHAFLTSNLGIRYLLVCGFSLLFLLLGAKNFPMSSISRRSHPPAALRLATLVHVEANLSRSTSQTAVTPRMGDAVRLAFSCWASVMQRRDMDAMLAKGTTVASISGWTTDKGMELSGRQTVLDEWDEVRAHLYRLAAYRRSAEKQLREKAIAPRGAWIDWYSEGDIS